MGHALPRWGPAEGRHHIPTVGTLYHRKRWLPAKVRVWFQPVDGTPGLTFTIDIETLAEIITSTNLAEARTLISLYLTDTEP